MSITPPHDSSSDLDVAHDLERLCFLREEGLEALAFYRNIGDADVRDAILVLLKALAKSHVYTAVAQP